MGNQLKLAFAGKMCVGKDTSADIWIKHYKNSGPNKCYFRRAFADGIKSLCINSFGLSHDDVYTQEGKKKYIPLYGKTVRQLLQSIGEGYRQFICKDFWVIEAMKTIDNIIKIGYTPILVTDVRYVNEVEALKSRGFTIIKLVRDTGIKDDHPSEKDLNDHLFDYVIDNNGTIEDLERKLLEIPEYQFHA